MLKLTCSLFLLCSIISISGAEPHYNVTSTENFDGKEHVYSQTFSLSQLSQMSNVIKLIQNWRVQELRDFLRRKGKPIITNREIGIGKVSHFYLLDLATHAEWLVECKNHQLPQDALSKLDAGTHALRARVERIPGDDNGVYYPTGTFDRVTVINIGIEDSKL